MSSKLRRLQRRGELGEDNVKYLLEITLGFLWDYLILGGKNIYVYIIIYIYIKTL